MKKKQLIALVFVFIISLCIPSWLWIRDYVLSHEKSIDSSTLADFATFQSFVLTFWSLIINIILVSIAYRAFRNFDVKKQFHNKQLEIVSELATAISSAELSNMLYETIPDPMGEDHKILTGYTLSFFEIAFGFNYMDFETIYIKSNNIENVFPFLKFRNHPLLPKNIGIALNKLYRPLQYTLSVRETNLPRKYVVLYQSNNKEDDISKNWNYEYYEKPTDFTADCKKLRDGIIEWYKVYGADDLNI